MNADPALVAFLSGALTLGYAIAGLFFLRFWARTKETLFLVFAAAFAMFAINQAIPVLGGIPQEEQSGAYLFRLAGFVLIIVAVLMKNAGGRKEP
jgi:zinc transporter ZupT